MSELFRDNPDAITVPQATIETGENRHRIWYVARARPEIVLVRARGRGHRQLLIMSRRALLAVLPTIGRYPKRRPPTEPQPAAGEVRDGAE